ncbi:uncharacterized protein N7484_002032 [Penicillium longicatenatum]|uniref:uncharacterized protein n=1 Tax=Penicillium longicatenatum TaxID=1561947 RepID=UPI0025482295|nr:uncharacterized protein N7484_002032 [Penicillium longicatenatum]KAJ5658383.1 hypothetical protein N7484_002032 [Penicillium longicatenatum]
MKLLTKEEEDAHYSTVLKYGTVGGFAGLAAGAAGVLFASKRYHTIRNLTIPMKAFLVTSSGTFVGIIAADHGSREFEKQHNAERMWYENREQRLRMEESKGLSITDRVVAFARREKYKIVGATWVASMVGSFVLVSRNPFLSGQQKLVQARVYAQGLTLGVLCASAAFEISDQRRGRGMLDSKRGDKGTQQAEAAESVPAHHDSKDEGDLWKEMVAAEEQRLKSKHQTLSVKSEHEAAEKRKNHQNAKAEKPKEESESKETKTESKDEEKDEGEKDEGKGEKKA